MMLFFLGCAVAGVIGFILGAQMREKKTQEAERWAEFLDDNARKWEANYHKAMTLNREMQECLEDLQRRKPLGLPFVLWSQN